MYWFLGKQISDITREFFRLVAYHTSSRYMDSTGCFKHTQGHGIKACLCVICGKNKNWKSNYILTYVIWYSQTTHGPKWPHPLRWSHDFLQLHNNIYYSAQKPFVPIKVESWYWEHWWKTVWYHRVDTKVQKFCKLFGKSGFLEFLEVKYLSPLVSNKSTIVLLTGTTS